MCTGAGSRLGREVAQSPGVGVEVREVRVRDAEVRVRDI
jgi:hypothetical protein